MIVPLSTEDTAAKEERKRDLRFLQEVAESEHPRRSYNVGCLERVAAKYGMTVELLGGVNRVRDPEAEAEEQARAETAEAERVAAEEREAEEKREREELQRQEDEQKREEFQRGRQKKAR